MNAHSNRVSKRLLPVQTGSISANQVPLHGASRTTRLSRRSNPIMSTRRIVQRPLPLARLHLVPYRNGPSSPDSSPSAGSPPSPNFPPLNSVKTIENALKTVEEHIRSELDGLRVSCSRVLIGEQVQADKLRAQSIAYQKERDFAWAKVKALMAEKMSAQPIQPVQRRSRSCGALSHARSPKRPSRSSSPRVSQPEPYLRPSASSSASSLVHIKREEEPVSLTSSRPTSPTSASETLVADDACKLGYPESSSSSTALPSGEDSTPLPLLKRCHSESSMAKATHFQWVELLDGTRIPLSGTKARSYMLNDDHLDVIFKEHHNNFICRMCILERKKLDKEKQLHFPVASFDVEGSPLDRYIHCLERHPKESGEMAKLPQSVLLEMQKGLAKTDRDDDFDLDYTLMY